MPDIFDTVDVAKGQDIFDSVTGPYVPPEIAQADAQRQMEQNPPPAPEWLNNAVGAVANTARGFIPTSARDVAGLATPVTGSIEDLLKSYQIGKDVLGGSSFEDATRKYAPEQLQLADAGQTPAYSKERFQAASDTLAQMLMAASIAKGHGAVRAGEVPKVETIPGEVPSNIPSPSENQLPTPSLSGEPLSRTPQEIIREGPPSAEDARGLPISKPVTQRFVQPEGNAIPDEAQSTANITRDAIVWRGELLNEGQKLGEQAKIMGDMGYPVPAPLADRITEINAELKRGYQPKQAQYQMRGGPSLEELLSEPAKAEEAPQAPEPALTEPPSQPPSRVPSSSQLPRSLSEDVSSSEAVVDRPGLQQQRFAPQTEAIKPSDEVNAPETSNVGIAHSYGEERFPGEVQRGEGTTPEVQVERGRELLQRGVDPGQIVRRVEKTGRISGDDMAVLRARLEMLQHDADTASEASRTAPNDPVLKRAAEQAMQNELDWRRTIKPAATAFHEIGMTLQGQAEVNYGTFEGLRRSAFDLHGKDVNPEQAGRLKEVANRVRRENQIATESLQRATTQVEQTFGRKAPPRSVEQLRSDLANRLRELTPC